MNEYKTHLKSTFTEQNFTVLNLEQLLQYLNQTRLDIYAFRKSATRSLRKKTEREQNVSSVIQNLAANVCMDIGEEYGRNAIARTIKASSDTNTPSKFDILVLVDANYETLDYKSKRSLMDQRFDKIHSFLVTEMGECKSQPRVHSVNLICSNVAGGGAVLMGAYLYCIKRTPALPQLGLLELAGGFKNTKGLCAYSKFGYIPNLMYLGPHCFGDSGNLPMSIDVSRLAVDQILEVVRGKAKVSQFDPAAPEQTIFDMLYTHPLCNRSLFDSDRSQTDLATKYNQLYRLMYQVRTLTGYTADADNIPNEVINLISYEINDKIGYYEEKKERTGKKLSAAEKTAVVREVVNEKIQEKVTDLTELVNSVQKEKDALLDMKIRKLRRDMSSISDSAKQREVMNTISGLEAQRAAINRFSGENAVSPESVRSAATTETMVSSKSPSIMSVLTEEERETEMPYYTTKAKAKSIFSKKKMAKKAARKTAKKLSKKRETVKRKTAKLSMPPKVPRSMKQAPWIPASPKSIGL